MEFNPDSLDEALAQFLDEEQAEVALDTEDLYESIKEGQYYREVLSLAIQKGIEIPDALTPHLQVLADPDETFQDIHSAILDPRLLSAISPFYSLVLIKCGAEALGPEDFNDSFTVEDRDRWVADILQDDNISEDQKRKYLELVDEFLAEHISPFALPISNELTIPAMAELDFLEKQSELSALRTHNQQVVRFAKRCARDNLVKQYGEHDDMSALIIRLSQTAKSIVGANMHDKDERRAYIDEVIEVWKEVWGNDTLVEKISPGSIHDSISTMVSILIMGGYNPNLREL